MYSRVERVLFAMVRAMSEFWVARAKEAIERSRKMKENVTPQEKYRVLNNKLVAELCSQKISLRDSLDDLRIQIVCACRFRDFVIAVHERSYGSYECECGFWIAWGVYDRVLHFRPFAQPFVG